ncbi:stationary phase inducible protein CsiE [Serratia entomophila]|jgi:transcriptional antiterminator|uniref:Stationary phase inducible protein CsiE n=1 Tax=Serratia entomophila TaxID=42906 RepID=A0ABY5CPA4_9GAMM|nr:stationary phase inducible protein CsiE [Serratia entomophila]USU99906.1 stationary phase inducible protein CsiE [Serratia entomophila]CAI0890076.1 stationary phase inducible protein CsiE [Serratia entomophila]CAI0903497.1 stationary phase inducible protein CsiE [Serratia entomophila]CAI0916175.1 stationary phase inducible protein CsiE [Serratia entomophila]CAI0929392.1 stationary phase inducible protein CsiE [Serratia entomophila]
MSLDTAPVPELSGQQRRCHLLLMLYAPAPEVQLETISKINGVAPLITRQDIAEVASEIQRFHQLEIVGNPDDGYRLRGSALNQRLCLIHWLRRALRCSPQFVEGYFVPRLRQALAVNTGFSAQLEPCIGMCESLLNRSFDARDRQFLQHYLCYCAWQSQRQRHPQFSASQRGWLHQKPEQRAAAALHQTLNQLFNHMPDDDERDFLVLIFTMLKNHSYHSNDSEEDRRLMAAIDRMVERFQQISGMSFSSQADLVSQLFAHLAPAVERCRFDIGIDNMLLEEVVRKYPRLMRTTQEALAPFEQEYDLHFSHEEAGLVAISFGAWLMQDNALQEKQVLLLTLDNPQLEEEVEYQIRELTLLPLNIKYLPLRDYLHAGAPQGVTLVISPYAAVHSAPQPPLVYTELPLERQQRKAIRALLEAP